MIELRKAVLAAALVSGAGMLAACGAYGPKGDRGLPPPPEGIAYPSLSSFPPDARRPLKSTKEQKTLEADLLARKRQPR